MIFLYNVFRYIMQEFEKTKKHAEVFRELTKYFEKYSFSEINNLSFCLDISCKIAEIVENVVFNDKYSVSDAKRKILNKTSSLNIDHYFLQNFIIKFDNIPFNQNNSTDNLLFMYCRAINILVKELNSLNNEWGIAVKLIDENHFSNGPVPHTFLSYSSLDKTYSFWLYLYFLENGGYLYVDWIDGIRYNDGAKSKNSLLSKIDESCQFLFLQTFNSAFYWWRAHSISSWCSWEIGCASSLIKIKKFTASVLGVPPLSSPNIIDDFDEMRYVKDGIIYC